jgi:hypothetical protein
MLVATLAVRKASIRRPEGMSNVLIIESSDVVISHRESAEKVYTRCDSEIGTTSQVSINLQGLEYVRQIH